VRKLLETVPDPVVAEIGVGIGATTKGLAETLNGRGQLHIFDFAKSVDELADDLAKLGFTNVTPHGNTEKYWDSYHWSLMKLWQSVQQPVFDYCYLDGSHAIIHDIAAFFLADRLLKVGGTMDLDDYDWTFASSKAMSHIRDRYMTSEQEASKQVKMLVDTFIKRNPRYEVIAENRIYRKVADEYTK
jgi:predicted O-methyltransferase YrrM